MADTFISYSRKDIAFAKIIHESLISNQIDPWIDWQDIPPSADWFAEIKEAIEQSDTFIFIISPTSVQSEICSKEIAHAELNNKRLIPIVIGDIETQAVPSTLQPLNWIFFKEEDHEYAKALEDLVAAITVDQPWLKAHTRIQNRSLEWERSDQETGYLLHGADLEEAERWLAQASGKEPEPTALQTQYILASRAQATRRQRVTLAGVAVGLVVAVVLGILAWTQRNVAVSESQMRATAQDEAENAEATAVQEAFSRATQQAIAEEQRTFAEARQLAALSKNYTESNYDLALLLSIEGYKKDANYLTLGSLLNALSEEPYLIRQFHQQPNLSSLAFSHDGSFFVSAGNMNIQYWDPITGKQKGESILGHTDDVYDIAISPDGSKLASASNDGTLKIWDLRSREQIATFLENDKYNSPQFVRFSSNGRLLACGTEEGDIWVWDFETQEILTPNGQPIASDLSLSDLIVSSDGQSLFALSSNVEVWDFISGEKLSDLSETGFSDIEMSPDGTTLVGFNENETKFYLWDTGSLELIHRYNINLSSYDYSNSNLIFHPNGNLLFLINNDVIQYIDLRNPEKLSTLEVLSKPNAIYQENTLAFNPEGKMAVYGGTDGIIYLRSIYAADKANDPFSDFPGKGFGLSLSSDETTLAITGTDSNEELVIHLWDLKEVKHLISIPLGDDPDRFDLIYTVLFHPDGYLIFSEIDDQVRFYDPNTGEMLGEPLDTGDDIRAIALSPNGKILAVEHWLTADQNLQLWDLEKRELIGELPLNAENRLAGRYFQGIAFSPDSKVLASGLDNGLITFWDVETLQAIGDPVYAYKDTPVMTLSYNQDGSILASSDDQGVIQLWNTDTKFSIGVPMSSRQSTANKLLFSHDGATLFSANDAGEIILWDVQSQQLIGSPIAGANARPFSSDLPGYESVQGRDGHTDPIANMLLTSDDQSLITMDMNGIIRIWDFSIRSWIERACLKAGRNLTQNEWGLYFPNESYRATCPNFPSSTDQSTPGAFEVQQQKEYTTRVREHDNMPQIFVPAGEFEMGSSTWTETGEPFMLVDLEAFWIDQTEVTNAQYALCVAAGQCSQPASNSSLTRSSSYYGNEEYADYPVIYVSAEQAGEYCEWVGGRIPTEAEWEKAARGTDGFDYPWGNEPPRASLANFHQLIGDTTKAGSYPKGISPYGALDMAGNVFEWTIDWYPYEIDEGEFSDKIRGGSFDFSHVYTWLHSSTFPGYYRYDIGFRCVSP